MLADQDKRDEFTKNLSQNFSVIASPGTGKTTAISERIANLVRSDLPLNNFAAVTYTNKAAGEIRERVYSKILSAGIDSETIPGRLDGIFFGTIHGLCARFLREHHRKAGLSEGFKITDDDRDLWLEFTSHLNSTIGKIVPPELRQHLASHFRLGSILARVRETVVPITCGAKFEPVPEQSIAELLNFKATAAGREKIQNFQEDVRLWSRSRGTCPFPEVPAIRGKNEQFLEKVHGYLQWKSNMENYLVGKIFRQYVEFKSFRNTLSYNDLTALTLEVLSDAEYRERHIQNYSIILDEAQDTDETQFRILLNLVAPNFHEILSGGGKWDGAQAGTFSMVGDPKQAIYSDRADVKFYISTHNRLVEKRFLKQLDFSVTMRCPSQIVEFVNDSFGGVFAESGMNFVPMRARDGAQRGCVEVLKGESVKTIAEIFSGKACNDLGVRNFSEICILAPRKSWLCEIAESCNGGEALPKTQFGFGKSLENTPSLPKWMASALHFMNNVCDHRELAGILREIFGISTREIIQFFNRGSGAACESIHGDFLALKHEQNRTCLPNFVRKIMDKFHLIQRIRLLNIFSEGEISAHYESIMDAAYRTNFSGDLEKEVVRLYKNPRETSAVDKNSIQLFSFHGSKGLEWPVVILPFMRRERKLMNSKSSVGAMENEQRMLFVACTRAKEKLIVIDDSECHTSRRRANMISSFSLVVGGKLSPKNDAVDAVQR
jgi:ATP-dependent exoDNAse (exonuclease V) beta subunit